MTCYVMVTHRGRWGKTWPKLQGDGPVTCTTAFIGNQIMFDVLKT